MGEAHGLVDRRSEGHRHHRANAWDGHQPAAHFILAHGLEQLAVERRVFFTQARSDSEQRPDHPLEPSLAGDEFADAGLELAPADRAHLQPEAAQDAADAALDIPQLGDQPNRAR